MRCEPSPQLPAGSRGLSHPVDMQAVTPAGDSSPEAAAPGLPSGRCVVTPEDWRLPILLRSLGVSELSLGLCEQGLVTFVPMWTACHLSPTMTRDRPDNCSVHVDNTTHPHDDGTGPGYPQCPCGRQTPVPTAWTTVTMWTTHLCPHHDRARPRHPRCPYGHTSPSPWSRQPQCP